METDFDLSFRSDSAAIYAQNMLNQINIRFKVFFFYFTELTFLKQAQHDFCEYIKSNKVVLTQAQRIEKKFQSNELEILQEIFNDEEEDEEEFFRMEEEYQIVK